MDSRAWPIEYDLDYDKKEQVLKVKKLINDKEKTILALTKEFIFDQLIFKIIPELEQGIIPFNLLSKPSVKELLKREIKINEIQNEKGD